MSRKYHITRQDIEDVLLARGQKVSVSALVAIAKSKNILVSNNLDRVALAKYVATIPFDNRDIEDLYSLIEYDQRREKMTCSRLKSKIKEDNIRGAVDSFVEKRLKCNDVLSVVSRPGAPTLILEYDYDEEDFGKARMLQIVRKKARIEFNIATSETLIRFPANQQCSNAIEYIVEEINKNSEDSFEVKKIDLSHIANPASRNKFFISLIKNMNQMDVHDVTGVKIARMNSDDNFDDADEDGDTSVPGFIKKAVLEGQALLIQDEFKAFIDKGFYISNIKWKAVDKSSSELAKVEFEAGFSDQSQCKDFKYDVKYIYVFEKDADILADRKKIPTAVERLKYLDLLEKSSELSIDEVA